MVKITTSASKKCGTKEYLYMQMVVPSVFVTKIKPNNNLDNNKQRNYKIFNGTYACVR